MFTGTKKRLFRWGASALAALLLTASLTPGGATANTAGRIKITAESLSQKITDWGYDIKQGGKATRLTTARAQEVFVTDGMDILRIPIYAKLAHPSNGTVTGSYYTDTVGAVGRVKAVKSSVKVFASLKLDGTNTFPGWVLKADGTVKDCSATSCPYGDLLYDYLNYMKGQSVIVDVLGMDNEEQFNKGNITPQKFADIVDYLQAKCSANGIVFPQMIAPENYGPSSYTWLDTLFGNSLGGRLDIAGVHYYSKNRNASYLTKLQHFADSAGSKTLWDSEFHWNATIGTTYDNAVYGLIAAFDEFDNLFQGMSWWSFNPESVGTIDAQLQTALVTSTTDAYPAFVDDQDGSQLNPGQINTRAFKQGRNLNLWVLNDTATGYSAKWVEIPGKTVSTAPSYTQWDGTTKTTGSGVIVNSDTFTLNLPAKTITLVTIPNIYPTEVDDTAATFAGSGWAITNSRLNYEGSSQGSSTSGDTATYTFNGTGIDWVGSIANNHGKAEVYIDGVLDATVDNYSPNYLQQQVKYSKSGLTNGTHTIKIKVLHSKNASSTGYKTNVDGFYVH